MKTTYKNTIASKRKIIVTYLKLLNIHQNISVTEIVKLAEINRGTFYLHFSNLEDVKKHIDEILAENFKSLERSFRQIEIDKTPEIIFKKLNEIISKDIEFYRLMINAKGEYNLISTIKTYILNSISNNFMIMRYVMNFENFKIIVQQIVSGALDTYIDWFKGDINCSLEELSNVLCKMIKGGLKGYLNYGN